MFVRQASDSLKFQSNINSVLFHENQFCLLIDVRHKQKIACISINSQLHSNSLTMSNFFPCFFLFKKFNKIIIWIHIQTNIRVENHEMIGTTRNQKTVHLIQYSKLEIYSMDHRDSIDFDNFGLI